MLRPERTIRQYYQWILKKVSFSPMLFEKELKKAIRELDEAQTRRFRMWCWRKFWHQYPTILQTTFGVFYTLRGGCLGS
jgi:transposase